MGPSAQQKPCLLRKAEGLGSVETARLWPDYGPRGEVPRLTLGFPDPGKGGIWRPSDLGSLVGGEAPVPCSWSARSSGLC